MCLQLHYNMVAPRASILLVYTGGTIGMLENPETGALEPLDFNYLQDNVPELRLLGCDISSVEFQPPLDSSAITTEHWVQLAHVIEENYDKYDGFVILHGTDTMAYTASALSFVFEGLAKPIVFTGSQLPVGKLRTDGKENLITAIEIAAARDEAGRPRVPEVSLFFENYLMRGNRTSKISADQFSAFESYNYPICLCRYRDPLPRRRHRKRPCRAYAFGASVLRPSCGGLEALPWYHTRGRRSRPLRAFAARGGDGDLRQWQCADDALVP